MSVPSEFWETTGRTRFDAVLERYDQQQLSAKMAVEYLAALFPQNDALSEHQQHIVLTAHHLMHDVADGLSVDDDDFEAILSQR